MDPLNDISDEDFVPFLNNLGVETYKKSFEWMLNDPNFAGVLRWMYNNLDHNNALTSREEYRYIELEKKGCLLSAEDLEASISAIQEEYPGICIPGDQESREDVELEVNMMKERIHVLEKQEVVVKDLIKRNDLLKEELTREQTCLSAAHHQCSEDESSAAEECIGLAQDLESLTDDVVDVIAENLEVYASCKSDKDMASRFFSFAPLDSYRQTQSLFQSHFDLFVSKNLVNKQNDIADEELRTTLIEAKAMEQRLSDAAFAYIDSKAALSGEQAKLALVSNYNNVHPSQITSVLMETQSALDLLEQEENILEQEMQNAVEELVKSRTSLAVNTAAATAVDVRQKMLSSLTHLCDVWQQAFSLDRLLYSCLRHELRTLEEFLQFATQLKQHVVAETNAISNRIQSMIEICAEQESCKLKLQTSNELLKTLFKILGAPSSDETIFVKLYNDMQADMKELTKSADEGLRRREQYLIELKKSSKPLSDHIFDGCTKHPNCWDRTVAALTHSLQNEIGVIDKRVIEASSLFTSVKNGDKQNMRKLWQWFLTDPPRLQAALKNAKSS